MYSFSYFDKYKDYYEQGDLFYLHLELELVKISLNLLLVYSACWGSVVSPEVWAAVPVSRPGMNLASFLVLLLISYNSLLTSSSGFLLGILRNLWKLWKIVDFWKWPPKIKVHNGNFLFTFWLHMCMHYKHKYKLLRVIQTESAYWSREHNEYALRKQICIIMFFNKVPEDSSLLKSHTEKWNWDKFWPDNIHWNSNYWNLTEVVS